MAPRAQSGAALPDPELVALMVRLLKCVSFADLPSSVLIPMSHAIGACSAVFMQFQGLPLNGETIGRSSSAGHNLLRATDAYVEGLYTIDPMVRPVLEHLRAGDTEPDRAIGMLTEVQGWRDEVQYRRFLEQCGISDVLAVAVPTTTVFGPEIMCLGFHRPMGARPFTQRDRQCVQTLLPALQAILRNLAHSDALSFSGHVINELGDAGDGTNLLVLDQDLRIRHANCRALRRLGVRRAAQDVQVDILGALRKRLMDTPPLVGERLRISLPGRAGQPANTRATQLEIATFRTIDSHLYYLVTEPDASPTARPDIAKHFGLTGREQEVGDLVCLGHNSTVVARQLGITRRTVENHLRSIYAKVGVNSRTQLAARWLRD